VVSSSTGWGVDGGRAQDQHHFVFFIQVCVQPIVSVKHGGSMVTRPAKPLNRWLVSTDGLQASVNPTEFDFGAVQPLAFKKLHGRPIIVVAQAAKVLKCL